MAFVVADVQPDLERLRADLLRVLRKVCPRWLADQADDLAQIATSRVLDRVRATGGHAEFSSGYLYRTAYSVMIDEIRRRRSLRETPMDPDLPARSHEGDPERQAISREIGGVIHQCLAGLAAMRRRAVTLHLLGHSNAEIRTMLACRQKQAENLVYRGLADLRACLKARGLTEARGAAT